MSAALAASPDSPFLFPEGCYTKTPQAFLAKAQEALRAKPTFRESLLLAPMPVVNVGRLRRWVELTRPESLHPLWLDASMEKEIVAYFAKHGLHVETVLASTRPLSYQLVVLT